MNISIFKGLFLEWSLRNLNFTKFNKEITWIYQYHTKKKKKGLIRDKVGIENAEIRVIK